MLSSIRSISAAKVTESNLKSQRISALQPLEWPHPPLIFLILLWHLSRVLIGLQTPARHHSAIEMAGAYVCR